jgi:hypothetical protein
MFVEGSAHLANVWLLMNKADIEPMLKSLVIPPPFSPPSPPNLPSAEEHGSESQTGFRSGGDDDAASASEAEPKQGVDQPVTLPTTAAHTIRSILQAKRVSAVNHPWPGPA